MRRTLLRFVTSVVVLALPLVSITTGNAQSGTTACDDSVDPYTQSSAALQACGITLVPRKQVIGLPDGGTEYDYIVAGHLLAYRIPPATLSLAQASANQLAYYGLPPRPTDPARLQDWTVMMSKVHLVIPPVALARMPIGFTTTYGTSQNWAGYVTTSASRTTYTVAEGKWNVLDISGNQPCTNNAVATWVGLGGDYTGDLAQTGLADKVPTYGVHQGWIDVEPDMNAHPMAESIYGHPGWALTAYTQHFAGGFSFYLC